MLHFCLVVGRAGGNSPDLPTEAQKTAVIFWDAEFFCFLCWGSMNKILLDIGARAFGLASIEVVLHSFVARLLLDIKFVIEPIERSWVVLFTLVCHRPLSVIVINSSRDLTQLLLVGEITP